MTSSSPFNDHPAARTQRHPSDLPAVYGDDNSEIVHAQSVEMAKSG